MGIVAIRGGYGGYGGGEPKVVYWIENPKYDPNDNVTWTNEFTPDFSGKAIFFMAGAGQGSAEFASVSGLKNSNVTTLYNKSMIGYAMSLYQIEGECVAGQTITFVSSGRYRASTSIIGVAVD